MILVLGLDKSCSEGQLEANSSEAAVSLPPPSHISCPRTDTEVHESSQRTCHSCPAEGGAGNAALPCLNMGICFWPETHLHKSGNILTNNFSKSFPPLSHSEVITEDTWNAKNILVYLLVNKSYAIRLHKSTCHWTTADLNLFRTSHAIFFFRLGNKEMDK